MNEKERQDIERDARHDVAARPNRPGRHEATITRFVGAMLYGEVAEEPQRPEEHRTEEK
jgi:hypothetical protein